MAWKPPAFVFEDPESAMRRATAEDLPIPNPSPTSFARVVRGAMTEEQCATLLASINDKGFTPALVNCGAFQLLAPDTRNGNRVIVDSPELADWLLEVLRPHLPEYLPDGSKLVALNERLRFLLYTPGQYFERHYDGRYRRPAGHPNAMDFSAVTVQFYLHDIPEEFGGATNFLFQPNQTAEDSMVGHQPECGSVLLFTQNLPHEGALVRDGLKYTIRTEAMYRRPTSQ